MTGKKGKSIQVAPPRGQHGAQAIERAEQAARESESRFERLADSAPVLIWVSGRDGVLFGNRTYLEYLGLKQQQIRGGEWVKFIHPDDVADYMRLYSEALAGERPFSTVMRLRRADGTYRWMKSIGVPRFVEDGGFEGYVGASFDVTDVKEADRLRKADQAKNEFIAMLAHELRNPLASIHNAVRVMARDRDSQGRDLAAAVALRETESMVRMVDDLLDASRITRGAIKLHREPCDMVAVLRNAIDAVQHMTQSRHQTVSAKLPGEPVFGDVDPMRLQQIFVNLLSNASKFTRQEGNIWVGAEGCAGGDSTAKDFVVSVRDDGMGISAEMLSHVFEIFTQADQSLERTRPGLGVGLTLAKRLAELHGGSIAVSSPGLTQGSEFTIRLPVSADPEAAAAAVAAVAERRRSTGLQRRILVVDDNEDAARMLSLSLKLEGHEVQFTKQSTSVLQLAKDFRPNVILLDIGMPGLNGYEVARLVRKDRELAETLLFAISGYSRDEDIKQSLEAGFDAHLTKPLDQDRLRALIAQWSKK